jgi:hypothetical protein
MIANLFDSYDVIRAIPLAVVVESHLIILWLHHQRRPLIEVWCLQLLVLLAVILGDLLRRLFVLFVYLLLCLHAKTSEKTID